VGPARRSGRRSRSVPRADRPALPGAGGVGRDRPWARGAGVLSVPQFAHRARLHQDARSFPRPPAPLHPASRAAGGGRCAASALGTAAYGLVDASKAFGGGISNAGFSHIREAVVPLIGAPEPAAAQMFGRKDVLATLLANWLNGVPKADQKAAAKSLIHMA